MRMQGERWLAEWLYIARTLRTAGERTASDRLMECLEYRKGRRKKIWLSETIDTLITLDIESWLDETINDVMTK